MLLLFGEVAAGNRFSIVEYGGTASGAFDMVKEYQPGPLVRGELVATIVDTGTAIELHITAAP